MHCYVDGALSPTEDAFLSRLMETGATESSSSNNCPEQMKEDREQTASEKTRNILHNIVFAINDLWCLKDGLHAAVGKELPNYGMCLVETVYCVLYSLFFHFLIIFSEVITQLTELMSLYARFMQAEGI